MVENTENGVKFYFNFDGKKNDGITEEIVWKKKG